MVMKVQRQSWSGSKFACLRSSWSIADLDSETGETMKVVADLIVGADGAHSTVRNQLQRYTKYIFPPKRPQRPHEKLTPPQNVL
jgi:2-polyprenyl-6-methoxyphenol hydroxylase-like FAD-dependent oxidoreductase